jgi:uncharacterized protein
MLIQFSVCNYRSISETVTLDFRAENSDERSNNIFAVGKNKLVKSISIYGANNSGKSNLIVALREMVASIVGSTVPSYKPNIKISGYKDRYTEFQIVLYLDSKQYRYGFTYGRNNIIEEWLFREDKNGQEEMLFERKDALIIGAKESGVLNLPDITTELSPSKFVFSLRDFFKFPIADLLLNFLSNFKFINDVNNFRTFTKNNPTSLSELNKFVRPFNFGFEELGVIEIEKEVLVDNKIEQKLVQALSSKHKIKTPTESENFEELFDEFESLGTRKVVGLSRRLLDIFKNGGVLVIDELETHLHPLLTIRLLSRFHDPSENMANAQLIFTTHDTTLLRYGKLRRDQIYFIEKDATDSSKLYSLLDFKIERGDDSAGPISLEDNYLQGMYGAIPFFGDLDLFGDGGKA